MAPFAKSSLGALMRTGALFRAALKRDGAGIGKVPSTIVWGPNVLSSSPSLLCAIRVWRLSR